MADTSLAKAREAEVSQRTPHVNALRASASGINLGSSAIKASAISLMVTTPDGRHIPTGRRLAPQLVFSQTGNTGPDTPAAAGAASGADFERAPPYVAPYSAGESARSLAAADSTAAVGYTAAATAAAPLPAAAAVGLPGQPNMTGGVLGAVLMLDELCSNCSSPQAV